MLDNSSFENWRRQVWYEHAEEYRTWNRSEPPYKEEEYYIMQKEFLYAKYQELKNEVENHTSQGSEGT